MCQKADGLGAATLGKRHGNSRRGRVGSQGRWHQQRAVAHAVGQVGEGHGPRGGCRALDLNVAVGGLRVGTHGQGTHHILLRRGEPDARTDAGISGRIRHVEDQRGCTDRVPLEANRGVDGERNGRRGERIRQAAPIGRRDRNPVGSRLDMKQVAAPVAGVAAPHRGKDELVRLGSGGILVRQHHAHVGHRASRGNRGAGHLDTAGQDEGSVGVVDTVGGQALEQLRCRGRHRSAA